MDTAHWVDRALDVAAKHPQLDAYEVRADLQIDRKHVRRGGVPRASASTHLGGVAVRGFIGQGSGFAYTNELSDEAIRRIIDHAADLAAANDRSQRHGFPPHLDTPRKATYTPQVHGHPTEVPETQIHDLLARAEAGVRETAPDATAQVAFGYKHRHEILADSTGTWVEAQNLHSTLLVQTVARDGGRVGDGNTWTGGERGVGDYEDDGGPEALGRRAGEEALEALTATTIQSGRYRTLCDNHLTGIMAHESFGHLTEYDLVASGWSVLKDRTGGRFAPETVTVRDVPVLEGTRDGVRVPYDQEGTPGQAVTMLDRGVLTHYLHMRDSAAGAGAPASGNARALNITHHPIVRMRNTYVEPGDLSIDEALEQLGTGVYLVGGRGGSPRADGSFMFAAQRGYLVERGELKRPIRMASIYGNVLDFLSRVEGLTRERKMFTTYFGGCGKWDQSFLHIGSGGPHVLVSEALVGGQGA